MAMNIVVSTGKPYSPTSQARVERLHGTLRTAVVKQMLIVQAGGSLSVDVNELVQFAIDGVNNSPAMDEPHRITPFELQHNRRMRTPATLAVEEALLRDAARPRLHENSRDAQVRRAMQLALEYKQFALRVRDELRGRREAHVQRWFGSGREERPMPEPGDLILVWAEPHEQPGDKQSKRMRYHGPWIVQTTDSRHLQVTALLCAPVLVANEPVWLEWTGHVGKTVPYVEAAQLQSEDVLDATKPPPLALAVSDQVRALAAGHGAVPDNVQRELSMMDTRTMIMSTLNPLMKTRLAKQIQEEDARAAAEARRVVQEREEHERRQERQRQRAEQSRLQAEERRLRAERRASNLDVQARALANDVQIVKILSVKDGIVIGLDKTGAERRRSVRKASVELKKKIEEFEKSK